MQVAARFHQSSEIARFLNNLNSPQMQKAAARGLTEHAHEQKHQSVVSISQYTGVPASRIRVKTRVTAARPGPSMTAKVTTADQAISLGEYGNPVWTRDPNPGWNGGSVSSMAGAQATAWNVQRTFSGTWVAGGEVYRRKNPNDPRSPAVRLYSAVLANELAKPDRPNVAQAERFAQLKKASCGMSCSPLEPGPRLA